MTFSSRKSHFINMPQRAELEAHPERRIDYTKIEDLAQIVTWSKNWGHFKEVFQNEEQPGEKPNNLRYTAITSLTTVSLTE